MTNELIKGNIFVIHALNGYEANRKLVETSMAEQNLAYEFVFDGDVSKFPEINLEDYFTKDFIGYLRKGSLSCCLNHLKAIEKIVERKLEYAIIFEDDPVFLGNFNEKFAKIWPEIIALQPGFIISLENTSLRFPSFWDIKKGKHLYRATVGRMAGAYLLDYAAAKAIVDDLKTNKCFRQIDWWHIEMVNKGLVRMYWAHPALTEQASHNGMLSATISSKKKTFSRRTLWLIKRFFHTKIRRLFPQKRIIQE